MKQTWLPYAQKNAPRYTSYPTAVQFNETIQSKDVLSWAELIPDNKPISVYVHVPFCEKLCWYCGCHTTIPNGYDRIARYFQTILQEIRLWETNLADHAGAGHLHFGGGTPNALRADDMLSLLEALHQAFNIRDDAEIAIELDPRTLNIEMIRVLAAGGVSRASLGVQDFNAKVQRAVNRVQPFEMVEEAVRNLRNWGITGVNFDLLYGLPFQNTMTVRESSKLAASLRPDRISAFGYAHVPWFAKHQKAIDETVLPNLEARFEMFNIIVETLENEGYVSIGLDHFARHDDPLAIALAEHRLMRNFQGYTDDACETLIAVGPSGISEFAAGLAQNEKNIRDWSKQVHDGHLPIARGVAVAEDDRLRREVISTLMCYMSVDVTQITRKHGRPETFFNDDIQALRPLAADGLCLIEGGKITVPESARIFLRSVAQAFDAYSQTQMMEKRHARAV